jgi:hypothetical protein
MRLRGTFALVLLTALPVAAAPQFPCPDADGDGYADCAVAGCRDVVVRESDCDGDGCGPFCGDCDETDPLRYPGADERCNGLDDDCDTFAVVCDCNDANAELWSVPGEALGLPFGADKQTLSWNPPSDPGQSSGSLAYDTLRTESATSFGAASCLESGETDLIASDPEVPPSSAVYHYLVRPENGCGEGSLGEASDGAERAGSTCP